MSGNAYKRQTRAVSDSVTRPANTDAYAAQDVVGTAVTGLLEFPNVGLGGVVVGATVTSSAYVATGPTLQLWLFSAAPPTIADNAAFAPTDAQLLTVVAVLEFDGYPANLTAGADGNVFFQAALPVQGGLGYRGSGTLYGLLVVTNAYVPVSAEVFTVRLVVHPD
jgi:hypothetical protein